MNLDDTEIPVAYYAVAGYVRVRNIGRRAVPPEVVTLLERLDAHIRMSRERHESGVAAHDVASSEAWIGAAATAELLGRTGSAGLRWVQRHADEIGAHRNGGRLFFRESDVIDYAERQAAHARTEPRG